MAKLRALTYNCFEGIEMKDIVKRLLGKVIVSCQAYEDTPLYGSENMKTMAKSVLMGGAEAIRACWPQDIKAIRELGDFPIIGINKVIDQRKVEGEYVIITPTYESAIEVIEAGADVLALDCTLEHGRGKEELLELLNKIKKTYPDIAIMADCETLDDCINAEKTGMIDILATTLSGQHKKLNGPDVELINAIKANCSLPVNGEGSIWELKDLQVAIEAGADMVCIGSAITRPHLIAERFIEYNKKVRDSE